ncbi:MAG: fumarylacetoacetate hydrolase family protein [Alphaproteobacteria bacterium]|jgi:2-keto-4-pentenoate hydratase/2-oxohepta-3-ene-1,7-dioic acid hydratase in catechol pathway
MTDFTLLNYAGEKGAPIPGILVGDQVLGIQAALDGAGMDEATTGFNATTTKDVLWQWEAAYPVLGELAATHENDPTGVLAKAAQPLDQVHLLAPILYPDAIFCAFANFTDHMKEMSDRSPPDKNEVNPMHFVKLGAHCVVGPEAEVKLPKHSQKVDWEAELAVVIGKPARNVAAKDAMDYVAGFTIMNDLSLRDCGSRKDWNVRHDFLSGKTFDTGAPMGPWITPKEQIKDVYNLTMKQWIDGTLRQNSDTSFMHFTIEEQIECLSHKFTLRPGDVIATGSPSGNGRPLDIYLEPGQDLKIEIQELGILHNPIIQGE